MGKVVVMMRGINVGGAKKVPMADLRQALTEGGWQGVSTILATGNVILESDDASGAAAAVEQLIEERFGVSTRCMARTAAEIDEVVAADPFPDVATDGSKYLAVFVSDELAPSLFDSGGPIPVDPAEVAVGDRVIYQWCPDGISAAEMVGDEVMRHSDLFVTARNWNTVLKIQDRVNS